MLVVTALMAIMFTKEVEASSLHGSGYIDYRVDTQQNPTAEEFNNLINKWVVSSEKKYGNTSKLRNQGQVILDTADEYGLNPYLFVAQLAYESGWGASPYAVKHNNFGGIKCMGKGYKCSVDGHGHTVTVFSSVAEGIRENGSLLHRQYLEKGYVKMNEVASRYLVGKNLSSLSGSQYSSINTYTDTVLSIAKRFGINQSKVTSKGIVEKGKKKRIAEEQRQKEIAEQERKAEEERKAKEAEQKAEEERKERERKEKEEREKELQNRYYVEQYTPLAPMQPTSEQDRINVIELFTAVLNYYVNGEDTVAE